MKARIVIIIAIAGTLFSCSKSEPKGLAINDLPADEIRELAAEAYMMTYPLVMNYATMYRQVADPSSAEYIGGFGKLRHYGFYTPENKDIVSPNNDTPYSWGWVDLRSEPWVLVMGQADEGRYYTAQCDDMWGFVLDSPGSIIDGQSGGAYLLATTEWEGTAPAGIKRTIRSESYFVGTLWRTGAENTEDLENVQRIQAGYKLIPLHEYVGTTVPAAPERIDWIPFVKGDENTIEAFKYVNLMLSYILPHELDEQALANIARLGIKAGAEWDTSKFSKQTKDAITAGIADAMATLDTYKPHARSADMFNTRDVLKTNYKSRALGVMVGIFGNYATQAVYIALNTDTDGNPVNTANANYQLEFNSYYIPHAKYFWSITMYNMPDRLLVDNPIDRYSIGSRSEGLQDIHGDGSISIYIRKDSPGESVESNWLPAPDGEPFIILRVYGPDQSLIDGTFVMPKIYKLP